VIEIRLRDRKEARRVLQDVSRCIVVARIDRDPGHIEEFQEAAINRNTLQPDHDFQVIDGFRANAIDCEELSKVGIFRQPGLQLGFILDVLALQ